MVLKVLLIVATVIFAVLAALAAWRFFTLHSKGTQVIIRKLPAQGLHGWRHGILRYEGDKMRYFKLRSLNPTADRVFERQDVEISGQRQLSDDEGSILAYGGFGREVLVIFHRGTTYEVCGSPRAEMALRAWVEAAPDSRMDRMNPKELRQKFYRG